MAHVCIPRMTFDELKLAPAILKAVREQGYETPTPIQAQAIPAVLEGHDILGGAQTGTGKTAAFTLPMLHRLTTGSSKTNKFGKDGIAALVLTPTRELAAQVEESIRTYGKYLPLHSTVIFGGVGMNPQIDRIKRGVDILVATPGRLLDLIEQRFVSLATLEILVLDEADQMLDLGFIHALRKIVKMLPRQRQTLFFSATMPTAIRELADQFLKDPATVSVKPAATTAERVDQAVTFVNQMEKQALLTIALQDLDIDRALVFTRTKHGADRVVKLLAGNGIAANAIHGNKSQPQRERALGEFKSGKVKIMVATDIAARGIDVSGVSHVFIFELPNVPEQYVHRFGRSARADTTNKTNNNNTKNERPYLLDI